MRAKEFVDMMFPYRTHLEREIDYLKAQLAQERRRVDVLQEQLKPQPKPVTAGEMVRHVLRGTIIPKGWDATRAEDRRNAKEPEEVPAGPDAGSESSDADSRATA